MILLVVGCAARAPVPAPPAPGPDLGWVALPDGTFEMGEHPVRQVQVAAVEPYDRCVAAGRCTPQRSLRRDLAGNAYEWVADWYHDTYERPPDDARAWLVPAGSYRVLRGGGVNSDEPLTTTDRTFHEPTFFYGGAGARCARDPTPRRRPLRPVPGG